MLAADIITEFTKSCLSYEGDIEETLYMWSVQDCKTHFKKTIKDHHHKYEANVIIPLFLSYCEDEEKKQAKHLDLSEIAALGKPFIEQYHPTGKNKVRDLVLSARSSAFVKPYQKVDYELDTLPFGLLSKLGSNRKEELRDDDAFFRVREVKEACDLILSNAAIFQRANDKWDNGKQQEFIFNLLSGYKDTTIVLFNILGDRNGCKILDGLQRLTAIFRLLTDPLFMIPTKPLSERTDDDFIAASEFLTDDTLTQLLCTAMVTIKNYQFETDLDAVNHYISINNGFTHSKADIKIALDYRDSLSS